MKDSTFSGMKDLAADVRARMNGWHNIGETIAAGTPRISSCLLEDDTYETEGPADASAQPVYRSVQDYIVFFTQT